MIKAMTALRTEDEIIKSWKSSLDEPMVTIRCATYNHGRYVEDALRGFLIQRTAFPVEVLIHDDASEDETVEILKRYQARYPRLIRLILQEQNQYSLGRRPHEFLDPESKGRYCAVCEGDDYWTDPDKLTIQVEFLERHPEYVISGHDAFIIDAVGNKVAESKLPGSQKRDFDRWDLQVGNAWILTMSWVYRNIALGHIPERRMVKNGDNFFISLMGRYGKSRYHDDIAPSAYRVHGKGVWAPLDEKTRSEEQANTFWWMSRYYRRIGDNVLSAVFRRNHKIQCLRGLSTRLVLLELVRRGAKATGLIRLTEALIGQRGKNWIVQTLVKHGGRTGWSCPESVDTS